MVYGVRRSAWETYFTHSGLGATLRGIILSQLKREKSTYLLAKEAEKRDFSLEKLASFAEVKALFADRDFIDRVKTNPMLRISYKETSAQAMRDYYLSLTSFAQAFLGHSLSVQRQLIVQEAANAMSTEPSQPSLSSLPGSETLTYMITCLGRTPKKPAQPNT